MEIPQEVVLDVPLISMIGKTEVSIENYKNILEFNNDLIRINTSDGVVKIFGKKLVIKHITRDIVNVKGVIEGLTLQA